MRLDSASGRHGFQLLLATGIALLAASAQAAPMFTGLGDLPGGNFYSMVSAISADGSTVVGESHGASGYEAFRWSGGVMTGLGDLPGGLSTSGAQAVSADGSTVVGVGFNASGEEAFLWTGGVMTGLGELAGGIYLSHATGVSADGATVVGYSRSASGYEAFRWTGGTMTGLGDLSGGSFGSYAWGVSSDGATVVGYGTASSGSRAFRWTGGVMTSLPFTTALDISADGSTIVGASGGVANAVRWKDGVTALLPGIPGADPGSVANAVSLDGSIAVGEARSSGDWLGEAVFWDAGNEIHQIDQVLEALGLDLTGWKLLTATGISDDGSTIVGLGTNPDGFDEAWMAVIPGLAVIPEPGTALLIGFGLLGLAIRRRLAG